jgi:Spy/CpxP family protein refolding chaperone
MDEKRVTLRWIAVALVLWMGLVLHYQKVAWAQEHEHSRASDLEAKLGLSPEQKQKLSAIHARYKTQKLELRESVTRLRQSIVSELKSDGPERSRIDRCLQDIVQLEGRRQKLMVDEFFEVMPVLSVEQRRIFREQILEHMKRYQK